MDKSNSSPIRSIGAIAQKWDDGTTAVFLARNRDFWVIPRYGERWFNLNAGAGGRYIYFVASRHARHGAPIKNILIASGSSSNVSVPGWTKVPVDLNKGAGDKYIYLFYKK